MNNEKNIHIHGALDFYTLDPSASVNVYTTNPSL